MQSLSSRERLHETVPFLKRKKGKKKERRKEGRRDRETERERERKKGRKEEKMQKKNQIHKRYSEGKSELDELYIDKYLILPNNFLFWITEPPTV
jgi:hypothetical protein